jgi:hypothetical protein
VAGRKSYRRFFNRRQRIFPVRGRNQEKVVIFALSPLAGGDILIALAIVFGLRKRPIFLQPGKTIKYNAHAMAWVLLIWAVGAWSYLLTDEDCLRLFISGYKTRR